MFQARYRWDAGELGRRHSEDHVRPGAHVQGPPHHVDVGELGGTHDRQRAQEHRVDEREHRRVETDPSVSQLRLRMRGTLAHGGDRTLTVLRVPLRAVPRHLGERERGPGTAVSASDESGQGHLGFRRSGESLSGPLISDSELGVRRGGGDLREE